MAKRAKASRTYRDSSEDNVGILGSPQGSGAPGISQSTTFSRPAKRDTAASSARRHMYNYRYNINAEDDDEDSSTLPRMTIITRILVMPKLWKNPIQKGDS